MLNYCKNKKLEKKKKKGTLTTIHLRTARPHPRALRGRYSKVPWRIIFAEEAQGAFSMSSIDREMLSNPQAKASPPRNRPVPRCPKKNCDTSPHRLLVI